MARTADEVFIPFTVGGGVRSDLDVRVLLELGADKVVAQQRRRRRPAARRQGCGALRRAVHRRRHRRQGGRRRAVGGLHARRPPRRGLDAVEWAKRVVELGAGELLLTSMDTDGHKDGYDIPLTRAISDAVEVPVIASGGCGTRSTWSMPSSTGTADAVLAASIFHFGDYSIRETKRYMADRGLPVRL